MAGAHGDYADGSFRDDAEVGVLTGDGAHVRRADLADFQTKTQVDALAEGLGELGDAAQEGGLQEEVVCAAILVDS